MGSDSQRPESTSPSKYGNSPDLSDACIDQIEPGSLLRHPQQSSIDQVPEKLECLDDRVPGNKEPNVSHNLTVEGAGASETSSLAENSVSKIRSCERSGEEMPGGTDKDEQDLADIDNGQAIKSSNMDNKETRETNEPLEGKQISESDELTTEPKPDNSPKSSPIPSSPFPKDYLLSSPIKLSLEPSDSISSFACHGPNLYVGTVLGKLLHLHFFEDAVEYMLITQLSTNEKRQPIHKIVLLPDVEVCLVLYSKTIAAFTFPELSPCHIGKIRDVQDFSVLSQAQKSRSENLHLDKIIVYTSARIRLVQISKSAVKLLKDINYSDAHIGVSTACSLQANYSKICVVANSHIYEVVDMQKPQKIPLFPYNPNAVPGIPPLILPFRPPGDNSEEYLLPICSDELISMAMFTNSSGDATRGTLTWPDSGYPTNGLAIEWPYVFGVFKGDSGLNLITASLETLQITQKCLLSDIEAFSGSLHLRVQTSVDGVRVIDPEFSSVSAQVHYSSGEQSSEQRSVCHSSHTVFVSEAALHCLVRPSDLLNHIRSLVIDFEHNRCMSSYKDYFSSQRDSLCETLNLVLLVVSEEFDRLKSLMNSKTDFRLLLLFTCKNLDEPEDSFWAQYTLPKIVRELLLIRQKKASAVSDRKFEFYSENSRDFVAWLIQKAVDDEAFAEAIRQKARVYSYTVICHDSGGIIKKLHTESQTWSGQNEVNETLMQYFQDNRFFLAVIEVFIMKHAAGNLFFPWDEKIINACLSLLSGKWVNTTLDDTKLEAGKITIKSGDFTKVYDLSALICTHLNEIDDESVYTKKLLEFVALQPEHGLRFIQKNSRSRFKSSHKEILQHISRSLAFDSKFPFLKAQYIEQSFQEMIQTCETISNMDFSLCRELVEEYMQYLNGEGLEMEYENLNILFRAFGVENDLSDPEWPKVTWMEFLSLNYRKQECADFLEVWIKLNELLLLLSFQKTENLVQFEYSSPVVEYSRLAYIRNADKTSYFLEIGDFTAAEHSALYAVPPLSREPILLRQMAAKFSLEFPSVTSSQASVGLESILSFYLRISDKAKRNYAVMHIVDAFGGRFFGINRILSSLPEDFPLMYLEKYLVATVFDMEEQRSRVVLKKAMAKLDSKRTKSIAKEFEKLVQALEK